MHSVRVDGEHLVRFDSLPFSANSVPSPECGPRPSGLSFCPQHSGLLAPEFGHVLAPMGWLVRTAAVEAQLKHTPDPGLRSHSTPRNVPPHARFCACCVMTVTSLPVSAPSSLGRFHPAGVCAPLQDTGGGSHSLASCEWYGHVLKLYQVRSSATQVLRPRRPSPLLLRPLPHLVVLEESALGQLSFTHWLCFSYLGCMRLEVEEEGEKRRRRASVIRGK